MLKHGSVLKWRALFSAGTLMFQHGREESLESGDVDFMLTCRSRLAGGAREDACLIM